MKFQLSRLAQPGFIAGLSLLLALTGGMTWILWQTSNPRFIPQPSQVKQPSAKTAPNPLPAPATQAPLGEKPVTQPTLESPAYVYWLQARGQRIEMVPVAMSRTPQRSETAALTEALNYLLTHPNLDRLNSTIPEGTKLLSLQIKPDEIHINLSQEFTQGGGTTSMIYRVAQVLYTATSLDPQAKVYLSVEGKQLNEDNPFGGEGLILQQPLTRQQFAKDLLSQQ